MRRDRNLPVCSDVHRWTQSSALGASDSAGSLSNVDRDDGGDDASSRRTARSPFFEGCMFTRRAWSAVCANSALHLRIFRGLVSVQPGCRDCPMGLAWHRAALTSNDRQKYDSLWSTLRWCRLIPVFTSQKCLPQSLSIAVDLFADRMARRPDWGLPDGMEPRPVLYRVLLAANAPALHSGRHESSLDRAARNLCFVGARRPQTLVSGASIRLGSGHVRNMDALFTANRHLITKAARDTEAFLTPWAADSVALRSFHQRQLGSAMPTPTRHQGSAHR